MRFDEFVDAVGRVLAVVFGIGLLVVAPIWISTLPCSMFRPTQQEAFCSPPDRSVGRAAVYAVSDWWDGVVIWQ